MARGRQMALQPILAPEWGLAVPEVVQDALEACRQEEQDGHPSGLEVPQVSLAQHLDQG